MGGRVGVDSRIAHGSTFWLELSLKRAADPASAPALAETGDAVAPHLRPRRPAMPVAPRPRQATPFLRRTSFSSRTTP